MHFLHEATLAAKQTMVGYSPERNNICTVGPFTFRRQPEIVQRQLDDALNKGAEIVVGVALKACSWSLQLWSTSITAWN